MRGELLTKGQLFPLCYCFIITHPHTHTHTPFFAHYVSREQEIRVILKRRNEGKNTDTAKSEKVVYVQNLDLDSGSHGIILKCVKSSHRLENLDQNLRQIHSTSKMEFS